MSGPTFHLPAVSHAMQHAVPTRQGGCSVSEHVLAIPGDPVPWQAAVKVGTAPNAPRKVPDRQSRYASEIVTAWERLGIDLWIEKGTPVSITCEFFVTRPKSTHYGSGRNERVLKPQFADAQPTGRPDLSNLVKMVEDALTGVLWRDDDQVTGIHAFKSYVAWWEQPRSIVRIEVAP